MANTSDLRTGAVIKYNGENCYITDVEFRKPGKGGAFFQVKMRNLRTGNTAEHKYNSGESIELVRIETRPFQYLYKDGPHLYFMDQETYDQIPVEETAVGDEFRFMKENETVNLQFEGEEVLSVDVPQHVNLRVTYTEPGFKGDTATNVKKPATLETGAEVQVPIFINENDLIRIDTRTGDYIERVKE